MTEKRFQSMIDTVFNCAEVYDTENNNKMICMCRLQDKEDIIRLLNEV